MALYASVDELHLFIATLEREISQLPLFKVKIPSLLIQDGDGCQHPRRAGPLQGAGGTHGDFEDKLWHRMGLQKAQYLPND